MDGFPCLAAEPRPALPRKTGRDDLVLDHLALVKHAARRIAAGLPRSIELQDLESTGIIGLLDAAEKFDPARGVKFKTYAELRVRGAILDSLRKNDWAPRSLRKKSRKLTSTYRDLEHRLGRRPCDEEVCAEVGISLLNLHALLNQIGAQTCKSSLEQCLGDDSEAFELQMDRFPDVRAKSPSEALHSSEMQDMLAQAIDALPKKERLVVSLYYYQELTMRKIAVVLGVNESRASQYHSYAMRHLRARLGKVRAAA